MSSIWTQSGSYAIGDLFIGTPLSDGPLPAATPWYYYPEAEDDHYAWWLGQITGEIGSGSEYFVSFEMYVDDYYVTLYASLRHADDPATEVDRVEVSTEWYTLAWYGYYSNNGHFILLWGSTYYHVTQSDGVLSVTSFADTGDMYVSIANRAVDDITYDGSLIYYADDPGTWNGFSTPIYAWSTVDGSPTLSLDIMAAMGSTTRLYEVIRLVAADRILCLSYLNHYGSDPTGPVQAKYALLDETGTVLDELDASDLYPEGMYYTSNMNIFMRELWRPVGSSSASYVIQVGDSVKSRRLNTTGDTLSWERAETSFKPAWTRSLWELAGWSTTSSYEDKVLICPREVGTVPAARGYAVFYVLDTIAGSLVRSERSASRTALSVVPRSVDVGDLFVRMVGQYHLFIPPYASGGS